MNTPLFISMYQSMLSLKSLCLANHPNNIIVSSISFLTHLHDFFVTSVMCNFIGYVAITTTHTTTHIKSFKTVKSTYFTTFASTHTTTYKATYPTTIKSSIKNTYRTTYWSAVRATFLTSIKTTHFTSFHATFTTTFHATIWSTFLKS